MASTSGQEEFLAVIRKSQEAVIAAVTNLAETVRTASPKLASVYAPLTDNLPKPPSVSVPFADKLPGPEEAVASAHATADRRLERLERCTARKAEGRQFAPAPDHRFLVL
jgi:hypothetical protein